MDSLRKYNKILILILIGSIAISLLYDLYNTSTEEQLICGCSKYKTSDYEHINNLLYCVKNRQSKHLLTMKEKRACHLLHQKNL